jgi:hypothetical protein
MKNPLGRLLDPGWSGLLLVTLLNSCAPVSPPADEQPIYTPGASANSRSGEISARYVTGTRFRKVTKTDCLIRGGEYLAADVAFNDEDWVNCIFPVHARQMGDPTYRESRQVLASAYDYLYRPAIELSGYGLYSYVLFPRHSTRSQRFLEELFETTSFVEMSRLAFENLNIIYLPIRIEQRSKLLPLISNGSAPPVSMFSSQIYDYQLAEKLLAQICAAPPDDISKVCATDLSQGPYIVSFPEPASAQSPAPPPYLFVDLSNVHEGAFGEYMTAYKEQVKRTDYGDRERIDGFRLRLLSIILTSADWVDPIRSALADTVHMAQQESGGDD